MMEQTIDISSFQRQNISNHSEELRPNCVLPASPYITEPQAVKVTRLGIEIGAALVGIIGNLLVTVLAPRGRKLRSADGLYVRSLAIADLGILTVNFSIAVIREQSPVHWPIGKEMCYFLYPFSEVFHGACVWSIAAIALDRYRGIIHRRHQSAQSAKVSIAAIWLGSFGIFVVPLFFIVRYVETECKEVCMFEWPAPLMHHIYIGMDAMLLYFVPLGLISYTYLIITAEIRTSSMLHKRMGQQQSARKKEEIRRVKQNSRTARLLTHLVIVFTITMLPLNAFRLVVLSWDGFANHQLFLVFFNIAVLGVVINSAADPIVYSIVSKDFISNLRCQCRSFKGFGSVMRKNRASASSRQTQL
ncbi:predicted protein [Nematostella vectensis]|uniref:G-protein coupled receptors family 1 profile domain-containing protein n=1 Tax=Nematostella vectensis TaxID=45351 RepID=A7SYQ1_NEMVE|nr:predicted protein [Nematostella vectensis]|eukprot:XP_001623271.1 predicted protein [Nematostella vectensis]